ncbi:MAG TPA: hypothetical protein EYQ50_01240 [Verrucomicrobiales bacterium]|nr:hypothetical protein [Verrucomicrobiales bacterium]HIL68992.1 hypothetical protein [Verrucomicrobiota bacterium]
MQKNDRELSSTLRKWEMSSNLPIDFKRSVWNEISTQEPFDPRIIFRSFIEWVSLFTERRSIVAGYFAVVCLVGVGLGLLHVKSESESFHSSMAYSYVRLVDPYLHADR